MKRAFPGMRLALIPSRARLFGSRWIGATVVALLCGVVPPAAASHVTVDEDDCTTVTAFFEIVPRERVRDLIPKEFQDEYDQSSDQRLQILAEKCKGFRILENGQVISSQPDTVWTTARVFLFPDPEDPSRQVTEAPHFDTFQFWLASNNPDFVQLLKQEGGQGDRAAFVKDLVFNLPEGPVGGSFTVEAPHPTPWPFTIPDGEIGPDSQIGAPFIKVDHWGFSERGWFNIGRPDIATNVTTGSASGEIQANPGTPMFEMLCLGVPGKGVFSDPTGRLDFDDGKFTVDIVDKPITRPVEKTPPDCELTS